jgi:hypothetical protein
MAIQSGSIANTVSTPTLRRDQIAGVHFGAVNSRMNTLANNKHWVAIVLSSLAVLALAFRWKESIPASFSLSPPPPSVANLSRLPSIILWAWERPEKLDFIDPTKVGVAYLAKTVYLRNDRVVTRPRVQSLSLPAGVKVIAVVRIETDRTDRAQLTTAQVEDTASEVAELARLPGVTAVQIDFDATMSEREFYRAVLMQVREKLPSSMPLSITALASWCSGDNWLTDLPVDEAVPMLFRLGVESRRFASRLKSGEMFPAPCHAAAGISTDEPITLPPVQRVYIFNPKVWSQVSFNRAMEVHQK